MKLVRDNIPGWHHDSGHTVKGRRLSKDELKAALIEKLHEEADEVNGALSGEDLVEEIGDVQQIIDDLCAVVDVSKSDVATVIARKAGRKGGFLNGEYIETVTIPNEDDKWAQYCRSDPAKYPEVRDDE